MKIQLDRREFIASTAVSIAFTTISPPLADALNKPLFTDRNLNLLFSKDARGRDLSQEQVNALAVGAAKDLRGFLVAHFDLTEVQAECQRQIPDDVIKRLSDFLQAIPAESGRLKAKVVSRSDSGAENWLLTITARGGSKEMYFPRRRPD